MLMAAAAASAVAPESDERAREKEGEKPPHRVVRKRAARGERERASPAVPGCSGWERAYSLLFFPSPRTRVLPFTPTRSSAEGEILPWPLFARPFGNLRAASKGRTRYARTPRPAEVQQRASPSSGPRAPSRWAARHGGSRRAREMKNGGFLVVGRSWARDFS